MAVLESRRRRHVVVVTVLCTVALGGFLWYKLARPVERVYADPIEHFKHGSIGTEIPNGLPYWIWVVLPRVFPDKLPRAGGYETLGVAWEPGAELPIGFTKKIVGSERVGLNCAVCHTASVRARPGDPPTFYLGGPSTTFRPQDYVRFLMACAHDPRFNSTTLMNAILEIYDMPAVDRVLYRTIVIPATRLIMLQSERNDYYWMAGRPDWGPGRTDMNPFQRQVMRLADDHSVGSTDIMAIWNMRAHERMLKHTDGMNSTFDEPSRSAALAAGASRRSIDIPSIDRMQQWLLDLPPPKYPFAIDGAIASDGRAVFDRHCALCHAFGGARTGTVIPLDEIGTDPNRNKHWPQTSADAFNRYATGLPWAFQHFRSSNGYVAVALDGVWLRAPYLHNGSVPTVRDLLEPPERRPRVFHRGYDVYDPVNLGFVSTGRDATAVGFRYDTSVRGNANAGHAFGTDLTGREKLALIEYLKTL